MKHHCSSNVAVIIFKCQVYKLNQASSHDLIYSSLQGAVDALRDNYPEIRDIFVEHIP